MVEERCDSARGINNRESCKKKRAPDNANLGLELADVLFSLVCIANYYHIDLDVAFKEVLDKYTKREWKGGPKRAVTRVIEPKQCNSRVFLLGSTLLKSS